MEGLKIKKGGKLVKTKWEYDESISEGKFVEYDISNNPIQHITEPCMLEDGVTLKDLFLVINNQKELFQLIIGNWVEEYVDYGLSNEGKPDKGYDPEDFEYLELYFSIYVELNETYGHTRPSFHGVGYELKEDYNNGMYYRKGERIPWGLMGSDLLSFINKPLKLSDEMTVYNDDHQDMSKFGEVIDKFPNPTYTLLNIVEGVFWELSFLGGLKETEEFIAETKRISDSILDNPEQFLKKLDK